LIILGVDPGSIRTGYGAIESNGRRHQLIEHGVLSPPRKAELPERLHFVHSALVDLITRLRPDCLAVEDLFHSVNTRTAIVLAHVRGVILQAGAAARLPVHAFSPATVKVQITGYGQAEKTQVALMVTRLLALSTAAPAGDATDALAVAICEAHISLSRIAR
jgi:crossover junction endodeoxyribonuclease RuvC